MDKKIILVLLILLVLAVYYCYTHESFTENFESGGVGTDTTTAITNLGNIAAQLLAGGNVTIPGNLTLNTNGQNIGIGVDSRNYFRITNNGNKELLVIGVGGSDMYFGATTQYGNNIVAGGSISAKGIANTGDISTSGKIIAGGRDILAEQDALKASIAALQASTIKNGDVIFNQRTYDGYYPFGDSVGKYGGQHGGEMYYASWKIFKSGKDYGKADGNAGNQL